ncbi:hypothetical protein M9H77_25236 [Catharanthus roseus]|uniref:Uncharacterized protein n=1 Tax=Catharanthus roseus TaxID=4058 RepID=A0ACC0A6B9_CATRO|nr:hypothetical protein M9H77_25236 [Catharanthus roseus]
MLGYKNENKLLDIRLRLDVMTADEVRWYRTGCRRFGLAGFPRGTMYSRPPYPASRGTQATKQRDVHVEEYFCGGTMARGTFTLIDRDIGQCSGHSTEFLMITWVGTSPAVTRGYRIPEIFPVAFTYW